MILEEFKNAQKVMCELKGFIVERMERERRDNAGCGAVRVLQKEMCELKEHLKNAHEDKTEVIRLIPRHRTTECAVEQVVDVPAPEAHEDKVEMTRLDVPFPQSPFVPLRKDKVEEIQLTRREGIEPVPQIDEDLVKTIQLTQQEHFPECVVDHIVDRPVAQYHEDTAEMTAARSVGAAKVNTGSVKNWFKSKTFRFHHPS